MTRIYATKEQPQPIRWVLADAILDRLPADGYLQAATACVLITASAPFLDLPTWLSHLMIMGFVPTILMSTTVLALRAQTERIHDRFERRFWHDFEVASIFFALTFLAHFPGFWLDSPVPALASRGLLLIGYAALLLSSEMQPHREGFWRSEQLERRLSVLTVGLLSVGLFGYFGVIPGSTSGRLDDTNPPISLLFVIFTGLLCARFFSLGWATDDLKWRSIYRALALATCFLMTFHGLRIAQHAGVSTLFQAFQPFLWACALALLVIAVRLRHHPFAADWKPTAPDDEPVSDPVVDNRLGLDFRTLVLALSVPLLHFIGYRSGMFSPAMENAREVWMLLWAAGLGALAFAQQNITRNRLLTILVEQRRIQRTLAAGDRRLKMVTERRQTDEALYYSREKYAKAFRTGPYAMAIMTRRDGRHLEANEQYLNMLGLSTGDLYIIRFPDLMDDQTGWRELDRQMRRHGHIRNFEVRLRDSHHSSRQITLSAESLRVDEEDCFVAICTDLTRRQDHERNIQRQQELLASCAEAAVVIDATGRIAFFNLAAARSFGWTDEAVIGTSAFDYLFEKGPELTAADLATKEGRNWMGPLVNRAADGSTRRLDCWWMPLDHATHTRQHRLILIVAGL